MPVHENGPDPRDTKTYYTHLTLLRAATTPAILGTFRMFARISIHGAENMPRRGAVILAANHITNYDAIPLQAASRRPIFYMAKAEAHRNPVVDWVFRQFGSFPVERGAHDQWAIRHAVRVLRDKQVLGMFPEGSRNKGHGLKTAKTGVARLALEVDCPILPVAMDGTQNMFRRFPHRTPVTIRIGELIYPERGESVLELTERMMFAIAEMLPTEQRGVYRDRPVGF